MSAEGFVRWQGIARTQFGVALNYLLGLDVALLGFCAQNLMSSEVEV